MTAVMKLEYQGHILLNYYMIYYMIVLCDMMHFNEDVCNLNKLIKLMFWITPILCICWFVRKKSGFMKGSFDVSSKDDKADDTLLFSFNYKTS